MSHKIAKAFLQKTRLRTVYIIRLQKITGRRKSLWHAVIIWTMKAMATSSYCLITKEKTASKSNRTISQIIIDRRLHYVRSISRSLQLLHGLQWLVRLRLGFQLLEWHGLILPDENLIATDRNSRIAAVVGSKEY